MGGDQIDAGDYWAQLREHRLAFFSANRPLWRVCVPQTAAPITTAHAQLVEWGGGLRWVSGALDPRNIPPTAGAPGGHPTPFRAGGKATGAFHPPPARPMNAPRRL